MKALFNTVLLLVFSSTVIAQSFSIDLTGGYCAPIASTFSSVNTKEFQSATYPTYYSTYQDRKSTSYGQGANVALDFNWFSKKDIGCGLRANLLFSTPFSYTVFVTYLSGNSANFDFTDKPFSFQLVPHISFKHDFKKVTPILELGMLIGITHVTEDYTASYASGDVVQSSINDHGGVLLGFYSSLGLSIRLTKAVSIMLAVDCSAGSYSPTQWDRTSFVVNGQDQLSALSTADAHGVYVKQLDPSAPQSSSQPHQELKFSVPFSNVGFRAGLAVTFGKKTRTSNEPEKPGKKSDDNTLHPF